MRDLNLLITVFIIFQKSVYNINENFLVLALRLYSEGVIFPCLSKAKNLYTYGFNWHVCHFMPNRIIAYFVTWIFIIISY